MRNISTITMYQVLRLWRAVHQAHLFFMVRPLLLLSCSQMIDIYVWNMMVKLDFPIFLSLVQKTWLPDHQSVLGAPCTFSTSRYVAHNKNKSQTMRRRQWIRNCTLQQIDDFSNLSQHLDQDVCKERFLDYVALRRRVMEIWTQLLRFLRKFGRVRSLGMWHRERNGAKRFESVSRQDSALMWPSWATMVDITRSVGTKISWSLPVGQIFFKRTAPTVNILCFVRLTMEHEVGSCRRSMQDGFMN
jgi:hypothetical protein